MLPIFACLNGDYVDSIVVDEGSAKVLSLKIQKGDKMTTREHALCLHAVEVAAII